MTRDLTNTPDQAAKAARAAAYPVDDRELTDCPECDGQGHHDIRQFGRHVEDEYVSVCCRWCDGTGTALTQRLVAS